MECPTRSGTWRYVDIAQPLSKLQPFTGERVIETEDLHHPAPSEYADRYAPRFSVASRCLRNTHIRGGVATTVQTQRVCASSVTVSTAIPPISSSGLRESPHMNRRRKWHPTYHCRPAPDHKTACLRSAFYENAPLRSNGSGEKKRCGVCIIASCFSSGTSPWSFAGTIALVRGRSRISTRTRLWHISAHC